MVSIPKEDILALIGKYLFGIGEEKLAGKILKRSGHSQSDTKVQHATYSRHIPSSKRSCRRSSSTMPTTIRTISVDLSKISEHYAGKQEEEIDERPVLEEKHPHKKVKLQPEDPNYAGTVLKGFSRPKLLETTVIDKLEVVEFHSESLQPQEKKEKKSKHHKKSKHVEEEEQNKEEEAEEAE